MKLVLASKNAHKLVEMKDILSQLGVEVVLESEAGVDVDVEETGATFEENAYLKAHAVMEASGLPAIADDSGLCVDALNGAPGVYSARYGGPGLDDAGRYKLLLENMRGQLDRRCKFVSAICCCFPNGDRVEARGECPQGGGRFWLRPHLLRPRPEKDLRGALSGGEERHLPPGQCPEGLPGEAGDIPEEITAFPPQGGRRRAAPDEGAGAILEVTPICQSSPERGKPGRTRSRRQKQKENDPWKN